MADRPLILLTFANDVDEHLSLLKEERRLIRSHFLPLQGKRTIELYYEPEASTADIYTSINEFRDRICIFHYGGHASSTHLALDDQEAHASGLAKLLGELDELQLVFLNGCSTQKQVDLLMEAGVKLVIATSVPIQDRMATEFAGKFYEALAKRNSINRAFKSAAGFVELKYGSEASPQQLEYRAMGWKDHLKKTKKLPWALYVNADANQALMWKVPKTPKTLDNRTSAVLMSMALHHEKIHDDLEDKHGQAIDEREFPELIIKYFPWPIGAQLRILQTEELFDPGEDRLKQILSTYMVSMQLLCWVVFAQLWNEKRDLKDLPTNKLLPLLEIDQEEYLSCDWLAMIQHLLGFCEQHDIQPFIKELPDFFEEEEAVVNACQFLQQSRDQLSQDALEEEVEEVCQQAESHLAVIHVAMAFWAKYRMKTIKGIDIINPSHKPPVFSHSVGELNTLQIRKDTTEILEEFSENYSILLLGEDKGNSLNLSPFVVDKNAFTRKPIPYVFMYCFQEDEEQYYLTVNHSIYKTIADESDQINTEEEEFEDLQEQWETFLLNMES